MGRHIYNNIYNQIIDFPKIYLYFFNSNPWDISIFDNKNDFI